MNLKTEIWVWGAVLVLSLVIFVSSVLLKHLENATFSLMPLSLALIQMFRDEGAFQKQKALKKDDQAFDLAFSSEAAKLTVQKQAEFGEQYLKLVDDFLGFLYKNGSDAKFLDHASGLTRLRRSYSLWIDKKVYLFLANFESSIREIGANEMTLPHLSVGEERTKVIKEIYSKLNEIYKKENNEDEKSRDEIVEELRQMIGISQVIRSKKKF